MTPLPELLDRIDLARSEVIRSARRVITASIDTMWEDRREHLRVRLAALDAALAELPGKREG